MPDVADENHAELVGRIHCLMFDSIVKHPCFAALPFAGMHSDHTGNQIPAGSFAAILQPILLRYI